jgi:hypothetical protein
MMTGLEYVVYKLHWHRFIYSPYYTSCARFVSCHGVHFEVKKHG